MAARPPEYKGEKSVRPLAYPSKETVGEKSVFLSEWIQKGLADGENPIDLLKKVKSFAEESQLVIDNPRENATSKKYWTDLDNLFYRTVGHAEGAFKINVMLNIVVAGIGLALISYAMAYSWINNLDLYSTAFGVLGVVSFITLFYFTPQSKIQKTTGDLTQMQMLYRTYMMQAEEVNDWYYRHPDKTIADIKEMNTHLEQVTNVACQRLETYLGEKSSKETKATIVGLGK